MITVTLAGKNRLLYEPVFRDLKQILLLYNGLANTVEVTQQAEQIEKLFSLFFGSTAPSLHKVSSEELMGFLTSIPAVCGLETIAAGKGKSEPIDWGYLYGHLCASMSWDYDYVDQHMTMSRLKELQSYWLKHPPTHLLVAAFMGYEKQEQDSVKAFFNKIKASVGKS